MLSKLDEHLRHQAPTTLDEPVTSDHRFYDRYWLGAYHPEGKLRVITGMGLYANMNVLDGYGVAIHRDKQYNVRVSRQLRPNLDEMAAGPLSVEVVEPLQTVRIALEPGDHPLSFDLTWDGFLPVFEDLDQVHRSHGRLVHNMHVYFQWTRTSGWIEIEGERFEARDWFGFRDHTWGWRPGIGGWEPITGPPAGREVEGVLIVHFHCHDGQKGLYFQVHEEASGRQGLTHGLVRSVDRPEPVRVTGVQVNNIEFEPGCRSYRRVSVTVTTEDGQKHEVEAERDGPLWAYVGAGYDGGYHDGKGLGAYRGEFLEEHEVYDLSDPEDIGLPDGRKIRSFYRDGLARATVDGAPMQAHMVVLAFGRHPRFGLE